MLKRALLLLLFLIRICLAGEKSSSDTLRIHPLGDSITRGKSGNTYRQYLKQKIRSELGMEVDFVGSCPHAPDSYANWTDYPEAADSLEQDLEHDGWGGIKIAELTNSSTNANYPNFTIEELVQNYPADVLLLMIGTNDIYFYNKIETAPVRTDTLIRRILRTTDAHLIVSGIPPVYSSIISQRNADYNTALDSIVTMHKEQGCNISYVDNYSGMSGTDDILANDWVHPNSSGNKKIASVFFESIKSYLEETAIEDKTSGSIVPGKYKLYQNYPNPFNNDTTIRYYLPRSSYVNLKIYNMLGEEVITCASATQSAGEYKVCVNGDMLSSGLYFYKLFTDRYVETKKLVLLK